MSRLSRPHPAYSVRDDQFRNHCAAWRDQRVSFRPGPIVPSQNPRPPLSQQMTSCGAMNSAGELTSALEIFHGQKSGLCQVIQRHVCSHARQDPPGGSGRQLSRIPQWRNPVGLLWAGACDEHRGYWRQWKRCVPADIREPRELWVHTSIHTSDRDSAGTRPASQPIRDKQRGR
jgi:hypothetical protein